MTIHLHDGDLPDAHGLKGDVAVDCETMGLNLLRDRLCVVQISDGSGVAHVVKFSHSMQYKEMSYECPNLKAVLNDETRVKLFHFGRFDIAALYYYLDILVTPVYCTKIASRLVRTYTDRHGLKDLCQELIGISLDKQSQSSDWGAETLSDAQVKYAASDVLHLHKLRGQLDKMLEREHRDDMAEAAFKFLPMRAVMDLEGYENMDIFAHS